MEEEDAVEEGAAPVVEVEEAVEEVVEGEDKHMFQVTVPFHSIRQSRVTGPQKSTKCHDGHGHFGEVTKSFLYSKKKIKN